MATFTDIYKQELKGKGVLSSLGSAALKRTKERLDPRNMLFGGGGIFSATGQKIFGKGYSAINKAPTGSKIAESGELKSEALNSLLVSSQRQEAQLTIIAKNTMNSNSMARDINVMRQNIMKLVTLSGGKASRSADMFFKDKAAREAQYESQFKKAYAKSTTSPTAVPKKEDESSSIFSKILTALGPFGLAISALIAGLNGGIEIVKTFFGVLSSILPSLTTILSSLQTLASSIGSMLLSPLGLLSSGLAAAGVAIYKLSEELLNRAEKAGGAKGRELESKMQSEMMLGAMDPMGTSFVTGTNPYTGEKLLTPDDARIKQAQKEHQEKINAERMSAYKSRAGVGRDTSPSKVMPGEGEVSQQLVDFIKRKEGFRARAYEDYKQYSIGYGTKANSPDEVIDEAEAERRLRDHLAKAQKDVISHAKKYNYDWNQNQVDALTSFVYNLGSGALNQLTASGTRSNEEIMRKIPEYNTAGGKVVSSLVKRRGEELAMFTSPSMAGSALASASTTSSDLKMAATAPSSGPITVQTAQTVTNNQAITADKATVGDSSLWSALSLT